MSSEVVTPEMTLILTTNLLAGLISSKKEKKWTLCTSWFDDDE